MNAKDDIASEILKLKTYTQNAKRPRPMIQARAPAAAPAPVRIPAEQVAPPVPTIDKSRSSYWVLVAFFLYAAWMLHTPYSGLDRIRGEWQAQGWTAFTFILAGIFQGCAALSIALGRPWTSLRLALLGVAAEAATLCGMTAPFAFVYMIKGSLGYPGVIAYVAPPLMALATFIAAGMMKPFKA